MNRIAVVRRNASLGIPQWQLRYMAGNGTARGGMHGLGQDITDYFPSLAPETGEVQTLTAEPVAATGASTTSVLTSIGSSVASILSSFLKPSTTTTAKPQVQIIGGQPVSVGGTTLGGFFTTKNLIIAGGVIVGGLVLWKVLASRGGKRRR